MEIFNNGIFLQWNFVTPKIFNNAILHFLQCKFSNTTNCIDKKILIFIVEK